MSIRTLSIIVCLLMSMMAARQLTNDWMNPLQMPDPRNTINGQQVVLRFRFPTASAGNTGPTGFNSSGLAYKQFLGVVFPPSVGTAELLLSDGSSPKWTCALTDGTYTYTVTPVQSVASPIVTSVAAESNIAYCRLDDTSANVPLKVSSSVTYTLTITFTGLTKIASNYLRTVGLITSTANHGEKMIIDANPVVGSMAIYGDNTTSKILDITANTIVVNSEPSLTAKATTIYPYNSFDVTFSFKSTGFITAADSIIVLKYDNTVVSLTAPTISTDVNAASDPLQVALKGTLALKAFGTGAYYIDGIGEDLIPNRQFKITVKGWKALDLPTSAQSAVQLIVYYKNTYSVISYLSYPLITITKDVTTLTANHPESWDVYRGGAWPIAFTFKTTTDLINGGWVIIQHSNYAASTATAGNQVTFIPSTCDFSDNDASLMDQGFGKRNNCYPLRPLDNTYTGGYGSGFFFFIKGPIALKNTYKVTIWAFFDLCGGSGDDSMNILGNTYLAQPSFSMGIYKTLYPNKLNYDRIPIDKNEISVSSSVNFGQNCWNNPATAKDALVGDIWKDASKVTVKADSATTDNLKANVGYKEISEWVIFSETQDTHAAATAGSWQASPNADLSSSSGGIKFLYSATSANVIASGSFFVAGFAIPATAASTAKSYLRLPMPLVNTYAEPAPRLSPSHNGLRMLVPVATYNALAPGRFQWQFPSKWFIAGNSYKNTGGTCYCSWYTNKASSVDVQYVNQLLATVTSGKIDYSTNTKKNNHYFGAGGMDGSTAKDNQIEESKSYAGGDATKTGKDAIFRITSVFHNGDANQLWRFGDAAKMIALVSGAQLNVGLFTSCFKWNTTMPTITSLYTAIDIHIKWNYLSTASSNPVPEAKTGDGRPIMVWRLIKLFPETGVAQDWAKNSATPGTVNPFISHTVYSSTTNDAVCLLELSASIIGPLRDTASNTLILWIYGGTILETDYSDVSSTYPIAPLNSAISAYGNQNGYSLDLANPYAVVGDNKTPILEMLATFNNSEPISASNASLPWAQASSNYFFFMGSTLFLNGISSTNLTSASDNTTAMLIPYYCPRFPTGYLPSGGTVGQKTALVFPIVMAAYATMGGYNSITSVNTWVQYTGAGNGTNKNTKVFPTKYADATNQSSTKTNAINAGLASANVFPATLKWTAYSTTDATANYLYVYNGTTSGAGSAAVTCTGHVLFIASTISVDTTNPAYTGFTPSSGPTGYFAGTKQFYVFGKAFQKGVYYGIGAGTVPTSDNMAALTADGSAASTTYITNIKRPAVDSFLNASNVNILTDRVAYFGVALNSNKNNVLTNYITNASAANGVGSFLLDWYRNLTGAWATAAAVAYDKNDVYKSDPAANFKVALTVPASVPIGTTLKFTTGSNGSNLVCGIAVTANVATAVASQCTFAASVVSCTTPATGSTFTVCCYNVLLTDPIALTLITATFSNESAVSGKMTSDIYVNPSGSNSYFSLATTTTTADILTTKNAAITSATYSQTSQEAGIGKVTFTIALPREPIRNMKLTISSTDLAGLLIPGNTPRCLASFVNNTPFGTTWDNGDVLIETCSAGNISTGSVIVTTKNIIYKCGIQFNKTIYVSLWPVVAVNWSTTQIGNFKVNMGLGDTAVALANTAATWTISPALTTTKPVVLAQWDTLCAISSVTPKVPGELADWQFDIDLQTAATALGTATPNEVSIHFPYVHFGTVIQNLFCYMGTTMLNCGFTDESTLNIRFTTPLPAGKKTSILLVGVRNPALDADISIPCTVNTSNWSTGVRTINMTGSGKLTGGINMSAVTVNGAIRFLNVASAVSDKNPRNTSIHKIRMTFDYGVGLTATTNTIAAPVLHIYFPNDYRLYYFTAKPSVSIDEFTSDTNNNAVKTTTYSPASTVVSGNRIMVTFSQASITLGTSFRYWDITVSGVVNPEEGTTRTTAPLTATTRPFNLLLHSSDAKSIYRTYTNLNSYSSYALGYTVDQNLAWNRGNNFAFDNTKWALDVYAVAGTNNSLVLSTGRYQKIFAVVKTNTSNTITQTVNTISLTDTVFKFAGASYTLATIQSDPVSMWIGAPCGTAPGSYVINLTTSDTTNFAPGIPITITLNNNTKGTISFNTPAAVPPGGMTYVQYFLSDPNVDVLNVSWTGADGAKNDDSAKISSIVIAAPTVTPAAFSVNTLSPVYSTYSITNASATLPAQQFKAADPNTCFSFGSSNTISINMSGTHPVLKRVRELQSTMLATAFKYFNADSDATLTAKNSLKFTFTPPATPIFIYCALACFNSAYPADADIIAPKVAATSYLQFYSNLVTATSPIDVVFSNLVRGMQYKMRCIATTTHTDATLRTSVSNNYESFPGTGANTTAVNIVPSVSVPTQCAQWQFLADPGTAAKNAIVNYCQKVYSSPGYAANGCVACTFSDMSYTVTGVTLPVNITCATTTAKTRLRFLQTSTGTTTPATGATTTTTPAAATNTTTPVITTTVTVCPIPHPICATDAVSGKTYADFFAQFTGDLKTSALIATNLGVAGTVLNTSTPIITVTDAVAPDATKLTVAVTSSAATGAASWTATFPTPVQCFWQITDSTTAPTYSALSGCTDASWCGKSKVGVSATTISTTSLKAFTAGSTYQIYMGCTNDIPMAQKTSAVRAVGSFTIAAAPAPTTPTTPTNTTTTNTTSGSANFISFSMMAIFLLFGLLF
jgi:hypothetical protein